MSNREIIDRLKKKAETVTMPGSRKMYQAAVRAMEAQKDMASRQAVTDAINRIECTRYTTWYEFYQKVITAVEKLPPAQSEIIWCKDCKYASGNSRICLKLGHSPIGELDFCAWAERRTDG